MIWMIWNVQLSLRKLFPFVRIQLICVSKPQDNHSKDFFSRKKLCELKIIRIFAVNPFLIPWCIKTFEENPGSLCSLKFLLVKYTPSASPQNLTTCEFKKKRKQNDSLNGILLSNLEYISLIVLVFLLLTLNKWMPAALKIKFQINIIFNIFREWLLFQPRFRLFKKPVQKC